jgi:small nuclear ribonucleoprotein (snRNP)-like protein
MTDNNNNLNINRKLGLPLSMLQASKGLQVTLEMCDHRERWLGTVNNVDDNGNVELSNAKHWDGLRPARDVPSTIVRGNNILYVKLPEAEMTVLFPLIARTTEEHFATANPELAAAAKKRREERKKAKEAKKAPV